MAQSPDEAETLTEGFLVEIPSPLTGRDTERISAQLARLSQAARNSPSSPDASRSQRVSVVLHFAHPDRDRRAEDIRGGDRSGEPVSRESSTPLEDSLKLARAISGSNLKHIRPIAWVETPVRGSEVLLVLACESILVSPDGSIGNATYGEVAGDETTALIFQSIAKRRGLLPPEIVAGLVNPDEAVARVRLSDGAPELVLGEQLEKYRSEGTIVEEEILSPAGEPLVLSADQLREFRAAAAIVDSSGEVADRLGLAKLRNTSSDTVEDADGALLRVTGTIRGDRVHRWLSNLAATTESGGTNTWLVEIDSPGGDLASSISLAATLADPSASIRNVAGYVSREARGDAALIALACRPLAMHPDAKLGGSGADAMTPEEVADQRELIQFLADRTGRSEVLIRGLLDPTLTVYRYVNRRTGRIRYAVPSELAAETEDAQAGGRSDWNREQLIELDEGLSAQQAIELGLVDETTDSLKAVAASVGLATVPAQLADRGLVRWVERIGRHDGLAFGLLLFGFMMLSTEASAPGLGIPGFLAALCFAFFFWTKFLAGTAEWAELLAFGLGLTFLAIEIFVVPGVGIFGFGGLALTVLGVVLMSQTFVIPQNSYQANQLAHGVWLAMGAMGGLVIGFLAVRAFLPQAAAATGLAMDAPAADLDRLERVADFDHLAGQTGVAATRLRPSGKAKFGEQTVGVISDGAAIDPGQSIRVIQVHGNRIVVEAVDE
ncbi:NfeD family protein [Allorhodopirellula solitaria]|nr:NfeD family protein [Allorhodopirellula solitaria]